MAIRQAPRLVPRAVPQPETTPTLTVDEARPFYGIGRAAFYEAIKRGEVPSIRLGGRILIPVAAMRRHLGLDPGEAA